MKFFIDTANLAQIKEANELGILDGVTTNPSLMAKEGIKGTEAIWKHYKDICDIVHAPVSAEVISTDFAGMVEEILAAKAGASYVSPFIGRIDDSSWDGVDLIAQISHIYRLQQFKTQILAASIRNALHIVRCAEVGADVCTCPLESILGLLKHPLTDIGLAKFLEDAKSMK